MAYCGDYDTGSRIEMEFTTVNTSGVTTALTAGSCCVRKVNATSVSNGTVATSGIATLVTSGGQNHITIFTGSDSAYYTVSNDYFVYLGSGSVSGNDATGYTIGQFSLRNRAFLYPTTAARTLDVSATGEAGVDWANVGSPTTANALTNTTIATTQKVDIDTIKTNAVVNAGTITFPTTATLASTTNITSATGVDITKILGTSISTPATAGILDVNVKNMNNVAGTAITTVKAVQGLTTADTVVTVSGNVNGNVAGTVGSVTGAVGSVTGNVGGNVTGSVGSVVGAVGSVTGNVGGNVTGSVGSVVGAVGSVTGNVGGNVTGSVGSVVAGVSITAGQLFIKKNTNLSNFQFVMTDSTTHAPKTGVTVTATRNIDNAGFGACANAVSEVSNGWYVINLAAADLNGTVIAFRFTGASADDRDFTVITQA